MSFKVEWYLKKRNTCYLCCGCGERVIETFKIESRKFHLGYFCPSCMESLQAVVSPLSILVQTGKDTKET